MDNNKPAFLDFHRDKDSDVSVSDQTSETDYTLLASYISADKSEDAKNREIKAGQVREYIAAEKNKPLPVKQISIKQKLLNLLGLK
jgi:hypothetical protein